MSIVVGMGQYKFAVAALLIGLAATAVVSAQMRRAIDSVDQERFNLAVDGLQEGITGRLVTYIGILRASAGVVAGTEIPTPADSHAFVERLELQRHHPGIQGIGYTARIAPEALVEVVAERRRAGIVDFKVWPDEPARSEYHAIIYLEPLDRRNKEAIGYDMFTEPTRRTAMERARDTAEPAASGAVMLVQEIDDEKQPGFLIYMPVYEGGNIPETVEQRRARLRGFVYGAFRAGDLLGGILGRNPRARAGVVLVDGEPGTGMLLYRTHRDNTRPRFTDTRTIEVAGRHWTARMFSTDAFEQSSSLALVPFVASGGAAVSVLLAGIALLQTRVRQRAEAFRAQAEDASRRFEQQAGALEVARAEAVRGSRLKDEFLATLSHELRTPLNAILGWAHMLATVDLGEERQREAIDVILRNARVQAKLVEDLLDMNRIISGRLRLDMQPVDMREVIVGAIDVVRPTAAAKGVNLRFTESGRRTVMGDPGRLQQVMWNLLTNAIKFTPAAGQIDVNLCEQDGRVEVTVADTGAGIDPAFLPHVFERFRQADAGFTRDHGGLGLGLSIARSLAEMHAGALRAASPGGGRGATFTVSLPAIAPSDASERHPSV